MISHLKENNETYLSHLRFASEIGLSLIFTGVIFVLHGLLPISSVPKKFNTDATMEKLSAWNEYIRERVK